MSSGPEAQLFQVSGMWCSSCARALQHAVGRLPGVEECSVDFVTHTLQLRARGAEAVAAAGDLAAGLGYRMEPYRDLPDLRRRLVEGQRSELVRLALLGFFATWTMALALVEYTQAMGPLGPEEYRWLAFAMGGLSVSGILLGARKVYAIGLMGLLKGRPSIDSLLFVTSLTCIGLSLYNLSRGVQAVYFDSAILVITIVVAVRATLASLSARQLDLIYQSLSYDEAPIRVLEDGLETLKPAEAAQPGYRVRALPGEILSIDGRVVAGCGRVQSALFTGEADPVAVVAGSLVVAGELLLDGELEVEVEAYFGERQVDRLGKRVLQSFHEPEGHGLLDTVLSRAAPALLGMAGVALLGSVASGVEFALALPQSLSVLIVACPCALFFCRPLPLVRAQFGARRYGLVLLRPSALFRIPAVRSIVFDKTGTLTNRAPRLELLGNDTRFSESEIWALLAGAERGVQHPVAYGVLQRAAEFGVAPLPVAKLCVDRFGVAFAWAGERWRFGKAEKSAAADLNLQREDGEGGSARFAISVEAKGRVEPLLEGLRSRFHLALLSGDRMDRVASFAEDLGLNEACGGLSPEGKAERIGELQRSVGPVMYCGDGYNDAEAFAAADVAVCMPHAPAALRLAADVQLLRCDSTAFDGLFKLGRLSQTRSRQNIVFALSYNALAIPAAAAGFFAPWVAAGAMAWATAAVLLNSLR